MHTIAGRHSHGHNCDEGLIKSVTATGNRRGGVKLWRSYDSCTVMYAESDGAWSAAVGGDGVKRGGGRAGEGPARDGSTRHSGSGKRNSGLRRWTPGQIALI